MSIQMSLLMFSVRNCYLKSFSHQSKDDKIERPLTYVSKPFYEFICFLENTFLANANSRMMIAYNQGDLFNAMITAL